MILPVKKGLASSRSDARIDLATANAKFMRWSQRSDRAGGVFGLRTKVYLALGEAGLPP